MQEPVDALKGCFAAVLAAATLFHISVPDLVLVANQNFLVLYLVCIYACWKIERGAPRWLLTPLAHSRGLGA